MSENKYIINESHRVGERLDVFLASRLKDFSRTQIQELIRSRKVLINNKSENKSGYKLKLGDTIYIEALPEENKVSEFLIPENIALDIIYEDKDALVINKPIGLVVHPGAGRKQGTLANAVLHYLSKNKTRNQRPGIVHRLDKDTSGVLIVAKNDKTLRYLQEQFANRSTKKTYLAITYGSIEPKEGIIELALGRSRKDRKIIEVVPRGRGREAVTHYQVIKYLKFDGFDATLAELYPQTGRTHQIRVHLAAIGNPIIGDKVYGINKKNHPQMNQASGRMMLHAYKLKIKLTDGKEREFMASLPAEFKL